MSSLHRLLLAVLAIAWLPFLQAAKSPNFVVIFCDDMGYGDLGCYGHPTIHTPNLDRMAAEGVKFTQFYSASSVCTPSRAGLLTGRLPVRSGMCSDKRRVLFPNSAGGLPQSEITLAEGLKTKGYATAAIGKWHLGHLPQYLPTNNGFDSYFGIPYSNDMDRLASAPKYRESLFKPKVEYFNVPLLRDTKIIEQPADQTTITRRYTEETIKYIKANKAKPFFVYLAHSLPHVPLFTSASFQGVSQRGLYGDVIEEIDWSVGQVLKTLKEEKLADNTLVFLPVIMGHGLSSTHTEAQPDYCVTAKAALGKEVCANPASPGGPVESSRTPAMPLPVRWIFLPPALLSQEPRCLPIAQSMVSTFHRCYLRASKKFARVTFIIGANNYTPCARDRGRRITSPDRPMVAGNRKNMIRRCFIIWDTIPLRNLTLPKNIQRHWLRLPRRLPNTMPSSNAAKINSI